MDARNEREKDFTQAIIDHRGAMFRVARAMLHTDADAEDAVSAATLSAWQHFGRLRAWDSVRPWLMRITVNACHTILRKRKREVPFDVQTWQEPPAPTQGTPLWMYMEMLPKEYAVVLQMRFGEGMSLEEIGTALRLPKGTVSSRITRGKQALRQRMEQEGNTL